MSDSHDDEELIEQVAEAISKVSFQTSPKQRLISWLSNLAQAVDDAYRIEYIDTKEVYIMQTESKKQFKITIEPINSYKESPWNS